MIESSCSLILDGFFCPYGFLIVLLLQDLKDASAQVSLCSRLEKLLLKKKLLNNGDSPDLHAQKVWVSFLLLIKVNSLVFVTMTMFSLAKHVRGKPLSVVLIPIY